MFGIKINWNEFFRRFENRTPLERASTVALFVIVWMVGYKFAMWILN